jgi:hypothetical protein
MLGAGGRLGGSAEAGSRGALLGTATVRLVRIRNAHSVQGRHDRLAAGRASLALEDMAQQSRGEPSRRINTGGIVIVLGGGQSALPTPAPVIEQVARHPEEIEADRDDD